MLLNESWGLETTSSSLSLLDVSSVVVPDSDLEVLESEAFGLEAFEVEFSDIFEFKRSSFGFRIHQPKNLGLPPFCTLFRTSEQEKTQKNKNSDLVIFDDMSFKKLEKLY